MPSRHCSLYVGHANGRTLLRPSGAIDRSNLARLEDILALVDGPVVVDCSRLDFIDLAGLEVLAHVAKTHDGMILRNPSPSLSRLVQLADLDVFVLDPPTFGDEEPPPPARLAG